MDRSRSPRPSVAPHLRFAPSSLGVQTKWCGAVPQERPLEDPRDPNRRPETQDYGGAKQHRMQERLPDPDWVLQHKGKTDRRLQVERQAMKDGTLLRGSRATFNPVVPIAGLPVPASSSLGSATKMAAHYKKFSPEHKRFMNMNPSHGAVMICGRPVILVQLSHEKCGYLETDMYVPWLFRPLIAHVLDGYTAGESGSPRGPKHFCVIRWFQVISFFMLGPLRLLVHWLALHLRRS